jgi:protein-tyrosine phosphatase
MSQAIALCTDTAQTNTPHESETGSNNTRLTLAAVLLFAGCASPPKPFSVFEVSSGIFKGSKPSAQADFDLLRAHGIRTILSLERLPWDIYPERKQARKNSIAYCDVPMLASPLEPSERRVKEALLMLNDPSLRPIFIHCWRGEDRTAFIVGLYRVYYEDWTPEAAWAEMLRSGFHVRPTLRGFDTYFWRHSKNPDWVNNRSEPG